MAGSSSIATRVRQDIEHLAAAEPAWQTWIALVEMVDESSRDPAWLETSLELAGRSLAAPLLAGATATIAQPDAMEWFRRLLKAACVGPNADRLEPLANHDALDVVGIQEAAINQHDSRLQAYADALDVDRELVAALAELAARPLLLSWAEALASQVPSSWTQGYCPVCGAWPAIAELRGLDRARWLRCVRCGSEWRWSALHCPYCGTTDHQRLGSLISPDEAESRKVDICDHCHGYVKTVAALRRLTPHDVALTDAGTVDLDVVALERGYTRPSPAVELGLRLLSSNE